MNTQQVWRLTVHFYPHAIEAGVRPANTNVSACEQRSLNDGKISPAAFYRSHEFLFRHPPSREDFMNMVRGLPWAVTAWENSLLLLLVGATNQWPMIDYAHKGAFTEVCDAQGRQVGHLEVWRDKLHENKAYQTTLITSKDIATVIGNRRGVSAVDIETQYGHAIRERLAEITKAEGGIVATQVHQAVREVLTEGGIVGPKRRGTCSK